MIKMLRTFLVNAWLGGIESMHIHLLQLGDRREAHIALATVIQSPPSPKNSVTVERGLRDFCGQTCNRSFILVQSVARQ